METEGSSVIYIIRSPFFADVNSDGLTDIVSTASSISSCDSTLHIFYNNGTETTPEYDTPVEVEFTTGIRFVIDMADYTGNGYPDLLASCLPTSLKLFENLGNNQYGPAQDVPVCDEEIYNKWCVGGSVVDYDGDGANEFVLSQCVSFNYAGCVPVILCECSGMGVEASSVSGTMQLCLSTNPSRGNPAPVVQLTEPAGVELTVHSLDGRLVYKSDYALPEGQTQIEFDMSGEPAGIYLLRAFTASGMYSDVIFTLLLVFCRR